MSLFYSCIIRPIYAIHHETSLFLKLWGHNVVASHPAGPVSILGRVNFLAEVFSAGFPQLFHKYQELWVSFVPMYHLAIIVA